MLDRPARRDPLQQILSDVAGRPTSMRIVIAPAPSSAEGGLGARSIPDAPRTAPRQAADPPEPAAPPSAGIAITEELRIDILENNPLAKAIAEQLGGRIVKIE